MKKININNELTLSYNEPFNIMTAGELKTYCGTAVNHWGIMDKENHCLFIVSWTKPGLLSFLTDPKSILKNAERCMKRNLRAFDHEDSFMINVGGKEAVGIRFTYTANDADIRQIGETSALRVNKKVYVIQYVSRLDGDDRNRAAYHEILKSVRANA